MNNKVNRIAVLTSGGDAPGMNAAIRSVVRTAHYYGIECLGIRRGYNGLIKGDVIPMDFDSVNGLIVRGGTILYTARCPEFTTEAGMQKAADTCRYLGIDGLVAIGGDGTYKGLKDFAQYGINTIGLPGTIDNDIACTDYTIGFDTACNTALDAIDKLRDTMQSHERSSIVEVMGRHAGHLALYISVACGAAVVLVPEKPVDIEKDVIEKIRRSRIRGRTHFICIVAEGVGMTQDLAKIILDETGIESRITILGHIQRGGSPTARDRVTASRMGEYAVKLIMEGKRNRIVAMKAGDLVDFDTMEALEMKKGLQESLYLTSQVLTTQ